MQGGRSGENFHLKDREHEKFNLKTTIHEKLVKFERCKKKHTIAIFLQDFDNLVFFQR